MPHLLHAKRVAVQRFLAHPSDRRLRNPYYNVAGVGIGPRIKGGKRQTETAIRLYVNVKIRHHEAIPKEYLLPSDIAGVPIDVVPIGRPVPAVVISHRIEPVPQPGLSIGVAREFQLMSGTFGAVVEVAGKRHLLTNNHVLADNDPASLGRKVLQPGPSVGPGREIGILRQYLPVTPGAIADADAAIAELLVAADPKVLDPIGRIASALPGSAAEGMEVEKIGAGTGHTLGTIFDAEADFVVMHSFGAVTLRDQILIHNGEGYFAFSGDSGSLIVERSAKRAIGLLCAYSYDREQGFFGIANRLDRVLAGLAATLVT
jgi:Peptidase family S64